MSAFIHHVDEDDDIKQQLSNSPLSLVVAVASFAPKSKVLLQGIAGLEKDYEGGTSCCGPSPIKPSVLVIKTDASDELEEIAIELGLSDVPSYQIYKHGTIVGSSSSENKKSHITLDEIRDELKSASAAAATSDTSTSCCPPPPPPSNGNAAAVCCPDGSNSANAPSDPAEVLRLVQQSYANTVNQSKGDGEGCCVSVNPETLGYTQEQIIKAGKDSNLGLGW